eukprot:5495810-Amphidinium_carterae.1
MQLNATEVSDKPMQYCSGKLTCCLKKYKSIIALVVATATLEPCMLGDVMDGKRCCKCTTIQEPRDLHGSVVASQALVPVFISELVTEQGEIAMPRMNGTDSNDSRLHDLRAVKSIPLSFVETVWQSVPTAWLAVESAQETPNHTSSPATHCQTDQSTNHNYIAACFLEQQSGLLPFGVLSSFPVQGLFLYFGASAVRCYSVVPLES